MTAPEAWRSSRGLPCACRACLHKSQAHLREQEALPEIRASATGIRATGSRAFYPWLIGRLGQRIHAALERNSASHSYPHNREDTRDCHRVVTVQPVLCT